MRDVHGSARRDLTRKLLWTTSLVSSVMGFGDKALAQSIPTLTDVVQTSISAFGGDAQPVISNPTSTSLDVALNAKATVIDWKQFGIPVANSADFNTVRADQISVLNRVVGDGGVPVTSQILGSLTSSANVSVFLFNPSGVLFGAGGSFSGGSLVLSTLDASNADFLDADGAYALNGLSTNPIALSGVGAIATAGSFLAVGNSLSVNKSITATGGSVALVAATDVDVTLQVGSPLAVTIKAGTTLGNSAVGADGQLSGEHVILAGAGTAVANLLNVDAGATLTATASDGRVIIAAGKGSDVTGVGIQATVAFDAGLAQTADSVLFAGTIVSPELAAKASGVFDATSTLTTTTGNIGITAAGNAFVRNDVASGGNYSVTASAVSLGNATSAVSQVAKGGVLLATTAGDLSGGSAGVALQSNSDQMGTEALSITAVGGNIVLGTGSSLIGGSISGRESAVTLAASAGSTSFGKVDALSLTAIGDAGITASGSITTSSSVALVSVGAVSVQGVETKGVTQDISLTSSGSTVTVNGALTSTGGVLLDASGLATVSGAVIAATDYSVKGSAVTLGTAATVISQSAAGAVTIEARDATVAGIAKGLGTLTLTANSNNSGTEGLSISALGGGIDFDPASTLAGSRTLGNESLLSLQAGAKNISIGAATGGQVRLLTTAGNVTAAGNILSTDNVMVATSGAISVKGVEVTDPGKLISLVSSASSVTADGLLKAAGDVTVDANTSASISGDLGAGGNYLAKGASVTLGNVTTAVTQKAVGALTLMSSAGSITGGTAGITLQSNSDQTGTEALVVMATGGNVALGSGSSLVGGSVAGRESAVTITAGTGSVSVGKVDALSLTVSGDGGITASGTIITTNSLSVTTPGAINLTDVETKGAAQDIGLTSTGGNITAGLVTATGALAVTASTGDLTLASGNAGTNASLSATLGDVFVTNSLTGGTGGSVTAGSDARLKSVSTTTGDVSVTASAGEVTGIGAGNANLAASAGDVSVTAGTLARLGTGSSGAGAGDDITVTADMINVDSATAGGLISLIADAGNATLGTGSAGTSALVQSSGVTTITTSLTAGTSATVSGASVSGGNVSAITGALLVDATAGNATLATASGGTSATVQASGNATLTSLSAGAGNATLTATGGNARANSVSATGGSVTVSALTDVSGRVAGTRMAVSASGATSDVSVSATGGQASLGAVTAGRDVTVTAGSIDASPTITAIAGALSLTATASDISVGTVSEGTSALVRSVTGNATVTGSITATSGTATVKADAGVASSAGGSAGSDLLVNGVSVALSGTQSAAGKAEFVASGGAITGDATLVATSNSGGAVDGGNSRALILDATNGNITLSSGSTLNGGTARQSLVAIRTAGTSANVSLGTVNARTLVNVDAAHTGFGTVLNITGNLTLGTGSLGNNFEAVVGGNIAVGALTDSAGNITLSAISGEVTGIGAGNANLAANAGDVSVTAGTLARLGTVSSGAGAGDDITVTADIISVDGASAGGLISLIADAGNATLGTGSAGTSTLVQSSGVTTITNSLTAGTSATVSGASVSGGNVSATTGALTVMASTGDLSLASGSAGTTASLSKLGATGELVVSSGLNSGGDASINSSTDARIALARSTGGNVLATATGALTGFAPPGPSAIVTGYRIGSLNDSGATSLVALTGDIRIGALTNGIGNVSVNAGGSVTGLASGDSRAGPGANLTSNIGSVTANAGTRAAFGAIAAGTTANVTAAQISAQSVTTGSAATLSAGDALSVDSATVAGGNFSTASGASAPIALLSASGIFDPAFGSANISATGAGATVGVIAGRVAQLGTVAATTDVTVNAAALGVQTATAISSTLALTATTGGLYLDSGVSGGAATLTKQSGSLTTADDEIRVTTSLVSSAGLVINSSTHARVKSVSANAGALSVQTVGALTGLIGATPFGPLDSGFGRAILTTGGTGNDILINTGTFAQIGTGSATGSFAAQTGTDAYADSLAAGEDIALSAGGGINLGAGLGGDDIDITGAGSISLGSVTTTGLGPDNRRAVFGGGLPTFGAETFARSSVLVNAALDLGVTNVNAHDTVGLRTGTNLTAGTIVAGEDATFASSGDTTITLVTAGDDIDVNAGGAINLVAATSTGTGIDDRRLLLPVGSAVFAGEDFARSNVVADATGTLMLGTINANATLAGRSSATVVGNDLNAGEDIALRGVGNVTLASAKAGDDLELKSTAGNVDLTFGTARGGVQDDRLTTLDSGSIMIGGAEDHPGHNVFADANGNVTVGTLGADGSIGLRAGANVSAASLNAGEDIAASSVGTTLISSGIAGDDVDVSSTGTTTLPDVSTTGAGIDSRRVSFGNTARIGFGGETLGRSDVAVNSLADAVLGTVIAKDSIGVLATGSISATSLTAGEDIAQKSGGASIVSNAVAGDDIVLLTGSNATLTTASTHASGLSDREVTFISGIGFAASDSFGRSNIILDAGGSAVLGTLTSAATLAARAGGTITSATMLVGSEDIALQAGSDIVVNSAIAGDDIEIRSVSSAVNLVSANAGGGALDDRRVDFGGAGVTLAAGSEDHTGHNLFVNAASALTIGAANSANSIGLRTSGNIGAGSLTAGEDIATRSGGTILITLAAAGDDIDLNGIGTVTLMSGTTTGLGTDTRRVSFADGVQIGFGSETLGRSDLAVNTTANATLGEVIAKGSIGVLVGGAVSSGSLAAGEDISLKAGTDVIATSLNAGDDLILAAGRDITLGTGVTTSAGADDRSVSFGGAITVMSPEAAMLRRSNAVVDAGRNAALTSLTAKDTLIVRAGADLTSSVLLQAGEDLGLLSAGAINVTLAKAGDDVVAKSGGAANFGTVMAQGTGVDDRKFMFGSNIITIVDGEDGDLGASNISITAADANVRTASASRNLAITTNPGQLTLNTGTAGGTATLTKQGATGDLAVTGDFTAGGNIAITSATDVRLANDKAVTSTAGSINVIAAGSVFAVENQTVQPSNAQIDTISVSTNLTITGVGDVRANKLESTGGLLDINLTSGALTGTTANGGGVVTTFAGGKLSAVAVNQSIIVSAGSAPGNVANLRQVDAGKDVTITAAAVGVSSGNTLSASLRAGLAMPGTLTINSLGVGGLNLGLTTVNGGAVLNVGSKTAQLPTALFSLTPVLETNFDTVELAGKTGINVSVANALAQVGNATSSDGAINFTGRALTAGTVSAGGALNLTATGGGLYLDKGTAGLGATLVKQGGAVANIGDELRLTTSLASLGASTITSATSARIGTVAASNGRVDVTATTGAVTGLAGGAPAGLVDLAFGRANLFAAGGSNSVKVTVGTLAQLGNASAAGALEVAGQQIDVTNGTATSGLLDLKAAQGALFIDRGVAGTTATLTKAGTASEVRVTTSLLSGANSSITSSTNARLNTVVSSTGDLVVFSTLATTGVAGGVTANSDPAFARADLSAAAAGRSVSVTTGQIAQLGVVVAGKDVTVTAGNTTSNGAIDLTSATAGSGALLLSTRSVVPVSDGINDGDIIIGTGRSGTAATLSTKDRGGTQGNILVSSALSSGTNSVIDANGQATGGLVEALGGSTTITAGPLAQFDTTNATAMVKASATSVLIGSATAGSSLELTASAGQLTLGTGSAGTNVTLIKTGATGDLQVSTALATVGDASITSSTNAGLGTVRSTGGNIGVTTNRIALNGPLATVAAGKTVTLTNGPDGANNTVLGENGGNEATEFVLSDAELDRISTENLVIESGTQNVALGTLALNAATGSKSIKLLSTGPSQITLSGVVSEEASAARSVQIGGTTAANPSLTNTELAASIIATTTATAGGRITLPSAALELRSARIVFGLPNLIAQTNGLSPEVVAFNFVSRPNSILYNSIAGYDPATGTVLLRANSLTVRYTDFTLIQNTATAGLNAGIALGPDSMASGGPPRLVLYSRGETPLNSIALFGTINGFTGNAAGLLPNDVVTIREVGSNNVRITRSSSRLNGCAIGAPEQGCLTTQSAPPVLRLFDERQALIFRTADDAVLPFDPLVGTNNESLFIDFGGVSLPYDDAQCEPGGSGTNCPPTEERK